VSVYEDKDHLFTVLCHRAIKTSQRPSGNQSITTNATLTRETLYYTNGRLWKLSSRKFEMYRRVYFLLALIRLYLALQPSYLHPDEHFQGPEVIAGK